MNPEPAIMKAADKLSDIVAVGYGYLVAEPSVGALNKVTTLLNTDHIPISQGAVDEIAKLLAGVVVAIVSRFAFAAIEKFQERKEKRKAERKKEKVAKPSDQEPKNINLNNQK